MTRRLRHRLGHWLLRDENPVHHVNVTANTTGVRVYLDGKAIHAGLFKGWV